MNFEPPAMVVPPFIWVNYNDLTVLPHWKSWLGREMIPKWPYFRWGRPIDEAERPYFRLVKYYNLHRFMETPMVKVWPGKSTMLLRRWWTDCWNVEAPPPRRISLPSGGRSAKPQRWEVTSKKSLTIELCYIYILYGDGSIPINTIFSGMNIHLPAILMFTRGTRFWHTAIYIHIIYIYI